MLVEIYPIAKKSYQKRWKKQALYVIIIYITNFRGFCMKLKKIISRLFLIIEVVILVYYKDNIIQKFPFFSEISINKYDDLIMGLISSVVVLLLELINWLIVEQCIFNCKKTTFRFMRCICRISNKNLKPYAQKMKTYIFSLQCLWGTNHNQIVPTIANTAEGLICCADCMEIEESRDIVTDADEAQIQRILDDLVKELEPKGYKSRNQDIYTVHCTGMALYAIKRFIDLEKYSIDEHQEKNIKECLKKLLDNSSEWGWGFENQKYNNVKSSRTLSTFWALRALNIWGYSGDEDFRKILYSLAKCKPNGRIGFSNYADEKKAPTAMLCILANEIQNKKTKQYLQSIMKKNMKSMFGFLLKYSEDTEVEEYYRDDQFAKRLSWTHMTECLALKTLILYKDQLSWFQTIRVACLLKKACAKIEKACYYHARSMNWDDSDPFIYPSTYFISLLASALQSEEK